MSVVKSLNFERPLVCKNGNRIYTALVVSNVKVRTDFKISHFRTTVSEWRIVAYVNYFVQGVRFVHFF